MKRYEDDKYVGDDKDPIAVAGHFEKDAKTLSKEGKVAINGEAIFIGCFAMKVRNAYRFLMVLFAMAFLLMTVASAIRLF